jgi:hypothetical protein
VEWSSHSLVAVQDSLHLLESLQAFRVRRQAWSGHSGFKACVRSCALCCLRLHRNPPPAPRARLLALALLRWVRQQALLRARLALDSRTTTPSNVLSNPQVATTGAAGPSPDSLVSLGCRLAA